MHSHMTKAAIGVALTLTFPVEVLMKSAPSSMARKEASAILSGVTIGDNAVIGAGSVVTKDIPENMIAVGTPAKVVRSIYD